MELLVAVRRLLEERIRNVAVSGIVVAVAIVPVSDRIPAAAGLGGPGLVDFLHSTREPVLVLALIVHPAFLCIQDQIAQPAALAELPLVQDHGFVVPSKLGSQA